VKKPWGCPHGCRATNRRRSFDPRSRGRAGTPSRATAPAARAEVELGLRRGRATPCRRGTMGGDRGGAGAAALEVAGVRGVAALAAGADSELGLLRGAHRRAGRQEPQVSPQARRHGEAASCNKN
jgi:hypothetical protein